MVLIIGPGALGCVLAARWAKTMPVLLLGRGKAQESRLVKDGIALVSPDGSRHKMRKGLLSARGNGSIVRCEAAFVCVKSGDIRAAISTLRPWVGTQTAVVGLQNGIEHAALLRRAFGPARTVIGTCYIAADRLGPDCVAHTGGQDVFLAANGRNRKALSFVRVLLQKGGWQVRKATSEDRMLWTKLAFNSAVNPLGAACLATNGQLAEDPALRSLLLGVLEESLAIAKKSGHDVDFKDMARVLVRKSRALPQQRNSMLQDIRSGRKTEIDSILGPFLAEARRTRTAAPLLGALNRIIKRLESISQR